MKTSITHRLTAILFTIIFVYNIPTATAQAYQEGVNDTQRTKQKEIQLHLTEFDTTFSTDVDIHNGKLLFEGDIIVGEKHRSHSRGAITMRAGKRWSNSIMPYTIEAGHPRTNDILNAIDIFNASTNLCLIPKTTESDYVHFINDGGCYSYVGRNSGQQPISIGLGCSNGSIIHEICHAAGMYHEQSRSDRDNFITVNFANIRTGREGNFNKYLIGDDIGIYDYGSIMHYPRMAFSSNGNPTITVKTPPGTDQTIIGQRSGLSAGDIVSINTMYPTPSSCSTSTPFCSGTTNLTTISATFGDGSGSNDYINNSDCKWLIQPNGAATVTLEFNQFSTQAATDFVRVYDGNSAAAPLLGTFSGSALPTIIQSTGPSLFVHFTTNGSIEDAGWEATYMGNMSTIDCSFPYPALQISYWNSIDSIIDGNEWTQYYFEVSNWASYPTELFEMTGDLPACSANIQSSRTRVNILDNSLQVLNTYCQLYQPSNLNRLFFQIPKGDCPPEEIAIQLEDLVCNKTYTSNLLDIQSYAPGGCFGSAICYQDMEDPILSYGGKEDYTANGQNWTRYRIPVVNRANFPIDLFASAPNLPPCGLNTNSSRTWTNIYDADDNRLYGFCAITDPNTLGDIWFATPQGDCPPRGVYIQFVDRACDIAYTSQLLDMTNAAPSGCYDQGCYTSLPAPAIAIESTENYTAGGQNFTRYNLEVTNYNSFPTDLFNPAPNLAACGSNTNASRTWVNIYDNLDNYLYGFCALGNNANLNNIWFALPQDECPPDGIYIQLKDRSCEINYTSTVLDISAYASANCNTTGCPDLIVSELVVDSYSSSNVAYGFVIKNIGTAPANLDGPTAVNWDNVSVQAFLSADTIFNNSGDIPAGGTILGVSPLGYLEAGEASFQGNFGASASVNITTHPYLTLKIDWGERVEECNESNNTFYTFIDPLSSDVVCDDSYDFGNISMASNLYQVSDYIQSSSIIDSPSEVVFKAGNYITLEAGFHAKGGSEFLAMIDNCQSNFNAAMIEEAQLRLHHEINVDSKNTDLHIYPNPMQHSSTIAYYLTQEERIKVTLTNLSGKEVQTVVPSQKQSVGYHQAQLDATSLQGGMYFLHLITPTKMISKKVIRLK